MPELLPPTLRRFASNAHPAIRALILRRLPYLQSQNPELGWKLFDLAMQDAVGLWQSAERCLYYAYHDHFERVEPLLERIRREGGNKDMVPWGRISALSALTGHINFDNLLGELNTLDIPEAWKGVASVWSHAENIRQHREQCLAGIEAGLKADDQYSAAVAQRIGKVFRDNTPPISIPIELIRLFFSVLENDSAKQT